MFFLHKTKIYLFTVVFLSSNFLVAQRGSLQVEFETNYGGERTNVFERAIETTDGSIVALGQRESIYSWGGMDIALLKIDKEGQMLYQQNFGTAANDKAKAITENHLGQILIAGISETRKVNEARRVIMEKNVWIKCRDLEGAALWGKTLYKGNNTLSIEDLWVNKENQQISVVGIKSGKIWLLTLDKKGQLIKERILSRNLPPIKVELLRLAVSDSYFYLYGLGKWNFKSSRKSPFILKTDREGNFINFVEFSDYNIEKTGNIIVTTDGDLVMTGTTVNKKKSDEDAFYLRINQEFDKTRHDYQELEIGDDFDEGMDIQQVENNLFYLAGSTQSHNNGADAEDIVVFPLDKYGELATKIPWHYGTEREERGKQLLVKKDGSIWICGMKDINKQKLKQHLNYYFICLKPPTIHVNLEERDRESIAIHPVFEANETISLGYNDEKRLTFNIENYNDFEIGGLELVSRIKGGHVDGLVFIKKMPIPSLKARQQQNITFPIWTNANLEGGEFILKVAFKDQEGQFIKTLDIPIKTPEKPLAGFDVLSYTTTNKDPSLINKGETTTIEVTFKNIGERTAEAVKVSLGHTEGLTYLGDSDFQKAQILQADTFRISFDIQSDLFFKQDELNIPIIVSEQNEEDLDFFNLKVPLITSDTNKPIADNTKAPSHDTDLVAGETELVENVEKKNAKRTNEVKETIEETTIMTDKPVQNAVYSEKSSSTVIEAAEIIPTNKVEQTKEYQKTESFQLFATWDGPHLTNSIHEAYEIRIKGIAATELALEDFWIIHNGKEYQLGWEKTDKVKLKYGMKKRETVLITSIKLKPNVLNSIAVKISNDLGTDITEPIHVNYKTYDKGTLYVMSVGIPDENKQVKYTQKDAQEFAELFAHQKGKIFGAVETFVYADKESTLAHTIYGQLKYFARQEKLRYLTDKDAIVLFISSHGFLGDDNDFRLKCSDFNEDNQKFTSLDFEDDIIDILDPLSCEKFIFVDACHSGSINKAIVDRKSKDHPYNDAIVNITNVGNSVRIITSCGVGEYSYEDEQWENGAFTKALKQILSNPELSKQLDNNNDKALSFLEIYDYLKTNVREMVQSVKGKHEIQTPYMPDYPREEDTPFFAY